MTAFPTTTHRYRLSDEPDETGKRIAVCIGCGEIKSAGKETSRICSAAAPDRMERGGTVRTRSFEPITEDEEPVIE